MILFAKLMFVVMSPMDDEYKPHEGKKTKPGKEDDAEPTPPPAKKAKTKDEEKEDAEIASPPAKKARTERPPCFIDKTFMFADTFHIQIFGDSATVISWRNMRSVGEGVLYPQVRRMRSIVHQMWTQLNFGLYRWLKIFFNGRRDVSTSRPMSLRTLDASLATESWSKNRFERAAVSSVSILTAVHNREKLVAVGFWSRFGPVAMVDPDGTPLKVAISIPTTILPATAIAAETMACCEAMLAILAIVEKGYVTLTPRCRVLPTGRLAQITHPRLS